MAEVPNPVRLAQHIGWVVFAKVEGFVVRTVSRIERAVREQYARQGERDI